MVVGCNPVLDKATAERHTAKTNHRVAKWPVRSPEGKRRAKVRNRTGYYDKYNVGAKSAAARGLRRGSLVEATTRDDVSRYRLPLIEMFDGSFQESDAHEHGDHPREGES